MSEVVTPPSVDVSVLDSDCVVVSASVRLCESVEADETLSDEYPEL